MVFASASNVVATVSRHGCVSSHAIPAILAVSSEHISKSAIPTMETLRLLGSTILVVGFAFFAERDLAFLAGMFPSV